jgi:hypothetical protein
MSGIWKRRHGQIIRHRQPKGSETVKAEPTSTASDLDSTLSRGLPSYLAYDLTLYTIGRPIEPGIHGGSHRKAG